MTTTITLTGPPTDVRILAAWLRAELPVLNDSGSQVDAAGLAHRVLLIGNLSPEDEANEPAEDR